MTSMNVKLMLVLGALGLAAARADAALMASASLSLVSTDTSSGTPVYTYSIALSDIGSTTVGTFWYAWVPGKDFMRTSPTSIANPTGWQAVITGGGTTDGYAIQWKASNSGADIASGNGLTFDFSSKDSLAALAGDSTFYSTFPVTTSYVYSGGPFSDSGFSFAASVPETSRSSPVAAAGLFGLRRRRRAV